MEFITLCLIGAAIWGLFHNHKVKKEKERKFRESGILQVDTMKGVVFEEYLKVLMLSRGYRVQMTAKTGDYGADLVLSYLDKKIVVQAKRYKKKVGLRAVQEIVSAKSHYRADECWVITNNYFTEPAIKLASSNRVILINRDQLVSWMIDMKEGA